MGRNNIGTQRKEEKKKERIKARKKTKIREYQMEKETCCLVGYIKRVEKERIREKKGMSCQI